MPCFLTASPLAPTGAAPDQRRLPRRRGGRLRDHRLLTRGCPRTSRVGGKPHDTCSASGRRNANGSRRMMRLPSVVVLCAVALLASACSPNARAPSSPSGGELPESNSPIANSTIPTCATIEPINASQVAPPGATARHGRHPRESVSARRRRSARDDESPRGHGPQSPPSWHASRYGLSAS